MCPGKWHINPNEIMTTIRLFALTLIVVLAVPPAVAQEEPDTTVAKVVVETNRDGIIIRTLYHEGKVTQDSLRFPIRNLLGQSGLTRLTRRPGMEYVIMSSVDTTENRVHIRYADRASFSRDAGDAWRAMMVRTMDSTSSIVYWPRTDVRREVQWDRVRRDIRGRMDRRDSDRRHGNDRGRIRAGTRVDERRDLSDDERELQRMETEARRLAAMARRAEDEAKAEHEQALREHLAKIFEFKHEMQSKALERAREGIETRAETLEARAANRDTIIENRMNQLLGRDAVFRW